MPCPFEMAIMTYKSISRQKELFSFFFSLFPEGAIVAHEKLLGLQHKVGAHFILPFVPHAGALR